MSGDASKYVDRLTSRYNRLTKFPAFLTTLVQPPADCYAEQIDFPNYFDIDTGIGHQLDVLGQWIGVSRILREPLEEVFFSFDTPLLGFDEGSWGGVAGGGGTITVLGDEDYRILLRARILNNQWDGTIEEAYRIWDAAFEGTGYTLFIVDHGDLSITMGLLYQGDAISAAVLAMFTGGVLTVKPAGVRIRDYVAASGMPPIFALDQEGDSFNGLDIGSWAISLTGP